MKKVETGSAPKEKKDITEIIKESESAVRKFLEEREKYFRAKEASEPRKHGQDHD